MIHLQYIKYVFILFLENASIHVIELLFITLQLTEFA